MLTLWLLAAGLAAQTATAAPQQNPATQHADKITITGCVERADEVQQPTGSLGTTVDSLQFVLLDLPPETAGTTGTKPAPGSDVKGYRLDGDVAKLNPHVGHKVAITGFVDEPAATNAAAGAANGPKVKVESIRMIAETCAR